ncbi:MAG: DUF2380 domain-containing protein [Chromatiaceae bacterium]|nr:DUF2380 domain-containing protein [Chromatiaceae bacterium]MCP5314196.1 DUF2380 domain-containing protein [Chromatiaceae bacterium]
MSEMRPAIRCSTWFGALACVCCLGLSPCAGATGVAVLAFESRNLTPIADTAADRQYVASLGVMLEEALGQAADTEIVSIDPAVADEANAGVGYLFEHGDVAAQLARAQGADWIVVGRLHKPSFLFSYLMARLVDARTGEVAEDLVIEIKGQQDVVTRKGIQRLAGKLAARLNAHPRSRQAVSVPVTR